MTFCRPSGMLIELTKKCPLRCIHCFLTPEEKRNNVFFQDRELFVKILDDLVEEGALFLTFTGGEPLLHPNIWHLFEEAQKRHFAVSMKTSGVLIDSETVEKLIKYRPLHIDVSIYSAVAREHDRITAVPGSFKKSIRGISMLREAGIKVRVSSPLITPLPDLEKLYGLAESFDAVWQPDPFIFKGNLNCNNYESLILTDRELENFVWFMLSKNLYTMDEIYCPQRPSGLCAFGEKGIVLDADAHWNLCALDKKKIADARKTSVRKAMTLSTELREKIENKRECRDCDLLPYCQPCTALSNLEDGSYLACSSQRKRFAEILKKVHTEFSHG